MTTKEFEVFTAMLEEHGYKKGYDWIYEREHWYKPFGKDKNPYDEGRSLYQVFFNVYDWSKYWDRDPSLRKLGKAYSVSVKVSVSRVIDETPVELVFDEFDSVEEVERRAEAFFKLVDEHFDVPEIEKIEE